MHAANRDHSKVILKWIQVSDEEKERLLHTKSRVETVHRNTTEHTKNNDSKEQSRLTRTKQNTKTHIHMRTHRTNTWSKYA